MTDIATFAGQLRQLSNQLESRLPELTTEAAISGKTLVQLRVQEEGKDKDGNPYQNPKGSIYSEEDIPAFFYKGRSNNAGGEQRVQQAIDEGEGLSYADFRRANGLQTGHVDLTFTGRMWANFGITGQSGSGGRYVVSIGGINLDSADKFEFNTERYGEVLALSASEEAEVAQVVDQGLTRIVENTIGL